MYPTDPRIVKVSGKQQLAMGHIGLATCPVGHVGHIGHVLKGPHSPRKRAAMFNAADMLANLFDSPITQPTTPTLAAVPATHPPAKVRTPPVCRCGSTRWNDVVLHHEPHNGQSTRRDCAKCRRFISFPVWHRTSSKENTVDKIINKQ